MTTIAERLDAHAEQIAELRAGHRDLQARMLALADSIATVAEQAARNAATKAIAAASQHFAQRLRRSALETPAAPDPPP
jgi:hypothetical protein